MFLLLFACFVLSLVIGSAFGIGSCRAGLWKLSPGATIFGAALGVVACWWWIGWASAPFFGLAIAGLVGWFCVIGVMIWADDHVSVLYEGEATLDFSEYICGNHGMPGREACVKGCVPGFGDLRHASLAANMIEDHRDKGAERPVQVVVVRNVLGYERVQKLTLPDYPDDPIEWNASW